MAANKVKMHIKKGDLVQVISGARQSRGGDRGKQGKVLAVFPERNRVLVEGINRVTKHKKPQQTASGATAGGIEVVEAPIHASNVMLVDPKDKKPTRVGYREEVVDRDGKQKTVRVRISRRTGEEI
ncbi:50S ribosomal protein L24 [Brevibacterium sp. 50QC2O2]|jgi:large subunit ribosomal protein L24|uniref:50S ribosomal protein L24 n=1 Tax=Brevibacterium TaxID=1696 RepID=UPI00211CAF5F|nr:MULTISPECIES: 50S ribosomal protein L24 [unclassified Brevibacterium]MCQ9369182.1 50S ribosomal protein L24 [Brevibacterium sp. 91QC2O2]MCQ9385816.1 50S ribosomal protein L24 [Brevibacterium sp. 68QC2CO]MCQ9389395.1 50S ribosomal protein L24 [Brevibacterium sp. 50QC2O2]